MEKEINRWYKKLWETKGSRFIASKRYERIDRFSTITTYIITAYILCVNLLILIPNRPQTLSNDNLSFFSICASIIILVISIYIPSRRYNEIANKFHSCARDINVLYDKVCLWRTNSSNIQEADILKLIEEYNNLLKTYDINHSKLDYSVFKCENSSEYSLKNFFLYKVKIYSLNFINYYLIYLCAITLPILILFLLLK
ncbi:MAG: SLATT domain-containing protein [Chryseobacterium gambrini]|nr:SLATT domain-containing protein [Chryseobacterium gambrini]